MRESTGVTVTDLHIETSGGGPSRRKGRSTAERSRLPLQRPFKQPRMPYQPTNVVSDDELESIHDASMQILEEIGMDFLDAEARDLLIKAGAMVEPGSERVRFDREMVTEIIKTAPSEFTLHSRNPEHNLQIGGTWTAFGSVASAPNVLDLDRGRRIGNHLDYQNLLKLAQMLNSVHFLAGYPVEPVDLHASIRHLDATYDALTLTDKPFHAYSLGRQRNIDCLEMVRIGRGVDHETLEREPSIFTVINSSSPLRLDTPMLHGILEYSARNQVIVITPFTLA
ncbi:MAG: trimethylamine methyltransferase family protein, partial [Ilumatobacteraceae bacterium]